MVMHKHKSKVFAFMIFITLFLLIISFTSMANDSVLLNQTDVESKAAEQYEEAASKLEKIYQRAMDEVTSGKTGGFMRGMSFGEWLYYKIYSAYATVKGISIYLGSLSVLIGLFTCFAARKNKGLFKRSLKFLVFGVPLVLILFVFIVGAFI